MITQSHAGFKVTLGKKIKTYKIISSSDMDADTKHYNTLSAGKPYIIKVMYMNTDKTYAILCETNGQ